MSAILLASGFQHLESLQEFCTKFPKVSSYLDSDLEKVWICHKNITDIPEFKENEFSDTDYHSLYNTVKNKLKSVQNFTALLTEFRTTSIFEKIYSHFGLFLTTYIFTKCYLFYNWGINAFEPVIDHLEIHEKISNYEKSHSLNRSSHKRKRYVEKLINNTRPTKSERRIKREKSVDLFDEPSFSDATHTVSKMITLKSCKNAIQSARPFFDLPRNSNDPFQESFDLKSILYDTKQKPNWPRNHILSHNDVDQLLTFIIELPIEVRTKNKLIYESSNWVTLKGLLEMFLKKHTEIAKNNGYGRILKKHLKSGGVSVEKKLRPISKSIVSSYILDILRRVLPLELFGCNNLRKKFFSNIIKITNGFKEETFIWRTVLGVLLKNKSQIAWCSETDNIEIQNLIILKLFKFIIINYVFIIFKNNFYVTETGSSGFGLRFYRKSDVESSSNAYVNNSLYYNHLRPLKKIDYDSFNLERKWTDNGVIDERDFVRNPTKTMSCKSEFKQAVASIRFLPKNDCSNEMRIISSITSRDTKIIGTGTEGKALLEELEARASCRKEKLSIVKLLLEFIVDKVGFGIKPVPSNPKLEAAWKKAVYLKLKYGQLYFVKADIADAFDSVKHNVLIKIIQETLEEESFNRIIQLKNITEWRKVGSKIKKTSRLSFSNRPKENSLMINRSLHPDHNVKTYDLNFVEIMKQIITQQRVEIKGRVFKLIKGLAQGSVGKFSPQLCEIYYSSMDRLYFAGIINSDDSILVRGVDDYLLITSDIQKGKAFLQVVEGGIEYFNARFKKDKLRSNLIDNIQEVPYLGLVFNFSDMSVRPNYSKYQQRDLLSTMKLSDPWQNIHFDKNYFLQRRLLSINSLKLQRILLSINNNDLKTARQTVFQACLMQSFRVLVLAKYLYQSKSRNDLIVCHVLFKSGVKIRNLISSYSGLSKNEINWMFLFAVQCVFQKYSGVFKHLLVLVRFELQRCEKILNNGASLLLTFLKADLGHEDFWKAVNDTFGVAPLKF